MTGTAAHTTPPTIPAPVAAWFSGPRAELVGAIVCGVLLAAGAALGWLGGEGLAATIGRALLWHSLGVGLIFGGRAAWASLAKKKFDIDVLMVLGAVLAAALGAPAEGALLLFLFTLSGALEDLAMERTTRSVEALSRLMPTSAQRWSATTGVWESVAPESLMPGDRIRILPGEIVPADSRITLGETAFDQANLTGESQPRDVCSGDEVYAGTINTANPVEAAVLRPAAQSSLQRIVELVTTAQKQRQPVQRLIDRLSQPYSIGVVVVSLAVFAIWALLLRVPMKEAAFTAMTLLIVASPCALVIATPTATLAAISRAARGGVLFKGGQAMERLARLGAVVFDKTGTLTIGRPRVMQVHPVNWHGPDALAVLAGLEQHSTHPIAVAVVSAATERSIEPATATDVKYIPGRGLSATILGRPAHLGSLAHVGTHLSAAVSAQVEETLGGVQHRGQIGVVCAYDGGAAVVVLADAVRPGAECLVQRMHELGVRPVVMLTGDNERTARSVATQLDLDEFHADLLPEDKVEHVRRLKATGSARTPRVVGVIGDGVNDAPALAAADAAIAIGSIGSDAALESADIVLLSDDLSAVPWAVALARRARLTIMVNVGFSLGAIGIMAVGVLAGHALGYTMPLWVGVLGHEGGTLLVVANSLLLLTHAGVPLCVCDKHTLREPGVALTVSAQPDMQPDLSMSPDRQGGLRPPSPPMAPSVSTHR